MLLLVAVSAMCADNGYDDYGFLLKKGKKEGRENARECQRSIYYSNSVVLGSFRCGGRCRLHFYGNVVKWSPQAFSFSASSSPPPVNVLPLPYPIHSMASNIPFNTNRIVVSAMKFSLC